MNHRAYSLIEIKAVKDDQRIILGTATTPTPDRVGDVVEPLGVKFKNPMPLLWQHDSRSPVGEVKFKKPTKDGIDFEARMPFVEEAGPLKDRVDTAWQEVKYGLVRAVSIGFRELEYSRMEDGGLRFIESEVLELSLVTIPANQEATIQTVKSIDAEVLAASGHEHEGSEPTSAGVTARKSNPVVTAKEAKRIMAKKTIVELISEFEATRQAKQAEQDAIMDTSAESGETLDAEQKQNYDELTDQIKEIDEHLVRLRAREESNKRAAVVVNGKDADVASTSRSAGTSVVQTKRNIPPGIPFVRLLGAKYLGRMHQRNPADIAKEKWPDTPEVEMVLRAPVAAMNTTSTTAAGPLVVAENMASEFAELLRADTIIGRIPGLRRVPFNIKVPRATQDASASWVGEGQIKPVSAMAFDSISLGFTKVAGIVPITQELMRFSNPAAEGLIRDSLTAAIAYLTDRDFLDPTKAESTNTSPASITYGVSPTHATGTDADALRADLGTLLAAYAAANMSLRGLVLVMTSQLAVRISLMRNALGQREFEGIGPNGGTLEQIPVVTSENIVATGGSPADGGMIVAINAPEILLADDGGVEIDVSTEASLQMNTAPDSPETASTVTVSLWQHNMVGIRAERFINWKKRRDGAVKFIDYAKYA